jgi:hypothetical protein
VLRVRYGGLPAISSFGIDYDTGELTPRGDGAEALWSGNLYVGSIPE